MEHIHTFQEFKSMQGISLVHIDSLNVILLIGGCNNDNHKDINCHRFCLASKTWKNIEHIKFPYFGGQALLTKDEKHIIVSNKFKDLSTGRYDDIYIIDIIDKDRYKLRKSKISSPTMKYSAQCPSRRFVLSGGEGDTMNEILVNGLVRKCKFSKGISSDVIGIICMYCNDEFLHCIRSRNRYHDHFVISVFDVLACMICNFLLRQSKRLDCLFLVAFKLLDRVDYISDLQNSFFEPYKSSYICIYEQMK